MQLKIENFGKIKTANVKITGLSVLTGNNDSGKSTVGKLLFSIIETIAIYKDHSSKKLRTEKFMITDNFAFSTKILEYFKNKKKEEQKGVTRLDVLDVLENFEKYDADLKRVFINSLDDYQIILDYVKKFKTLQSSYMDDVFAFKVSLQDVLDAEFKRQFNKYNSSIEISNGKTMFALNFDKEINFSADIDLNYIFGKFYNKVFFIENPWVLEHYKLLKDSSKTYLDSITKVPEVGKKIEENYDFTSLHIKELAININNCLQKQNFSEISLFNSNAEILEEIKQIVNGDFIYDDNQNKINFIRNNKFFDMSNIASGIKSFGILAMLLKADILDNRSLLILDEPEAHLHPVWQVKYAEIISFLVNKGMNILIASHSGFFVDTLMKSCKKFKMEDKTNFYYAFEDVKDGNVEIKNIKDFEEKENIIFKSFYEAYNIIDKI